MLKIKLLWTIIKSNYKLAIYIILFLFAFKFYLNLRHELQAGQRREHNLKSDMIAQWKKDSLAIVVKAQKIDSLEGVLLSRMNIKIKPDTVRIITTGHGEGKEKSFDWEDECYSAWGWFETESPYRIEQFIMNKPYSLEILMTDLSPNSVYGKVTPSNSCVEIDKVDFKVSPDIKGICKDGFDKGEFILGGAIGIGLTVLFIASQ